MTNLAELYLETERFVEAEGASTRAILLTKTCSVRITR